MSLNKKSQKRGYFHREKVRSCLKEAQSRKYFDLSVGDHWTRSRANFLSNNLILKGMLGWRIPMEDDKVVLEVAVSEAGWRGWENVVAFQETT